VAGAAAGRLMREKISSEDLATLCELERKVLWLATWIIHHANHVHHSSDGIKIGGHQASSARHWRNIVYYRA
jgi:pyruvate dehydrogenase complex dehydrogenase (E1) component